jgi:hypothetical protein
MRVIGLDVHRSFAQVAMLEDGVLRQCGRCLAVRSVVSLRTVATIVFMKTYSSGLAVDLSAPGDLATVVGSSADARS